MKKIIVANWKMNPQSIKEAREIFSVIKKTVKKLKKVETIICPPFVYLSTLGHLVSKRTLSVRLGAQDVFFEEKGAYTGEISAKMLKNFGVEYVIIGHSERRELGETNEIVNKKIKTALKAGLKVVFCVGEKERDFEDKYFNFIKNEIDEGLKGVSRKFFKNLLVAYEPIWAISSSKNSQADSPESAFRMAVFIRRMLLSIIGGELARKIPILYGGSVEQENVSGFLQDMQGALVGSKSLNPKDFGEILKIANSIK